MSLPLIDQSGKITQIVGHKYPDFCVLKVDDNLGLVVLMPDGQQIPGQVQTLMIGKAQDDRSDLVRVNMQLYISGFRRRTYNEICYVMDTDDNPRGKPVNGTGIRIILPGGDYLPGETGFTIRANDGEVVSVNVDLMIGDVIDNDGNSILIREIT